MIINDVKKLEQGVQFISEADVETFSDQRQLLVIYDAVKFYNEQGGGIKNFDLEKIRSNIMIWKVTNSMPEIVQILELWDKKFFGQNSREAIIQELNHVIQRSGQVSLGHEIQVFLSNLRTFEDLGHLLDIKDMYLQLLRMNTKETDYFETMQGEQDKMKKYGIRNDEIDSLKRLVEFFEVMDQQKANLNDIRDVSRLVDENMSQFQGYFFSLRKKTAEFKGFTQEIFGNLSEKQRSIYEYSESGLFWITWSNVQQSYVPGASLLTEDGVVAERNAEDDDDDDYPEDYQPGENITQFSHRNITLQNKDLLKFKMLYALETFENSKLTSDEIEKIKVLRQIILNIQKATDLIVTITKIGYFSDIADSLNWIHNRNNPDAASEQKIFYSSGSENLHIAVLIKDNNPENSNLLVQYLQRMIEESSTTLDKKLMDPKCHWITFLSKTSRKHVYDFLKQENRTTEEYKFTDCDVPYTVKFPLQSSSASAANDFNENPFNLVSYIMGKNEILSANSFSKETHLSKVQISKFWLYDNTDGSGKLVENILTLSCAELNNPPILDTWRFLLCSFNTSLGELRYFLRRSVLDPLKRVYVITNIEQLSDSLKSEFLNELEYLKNLRPQGSDSGSGVDEDIQNKVQREIFGHESVQKNHHTNYNLLVMAPKASNVYQLMEQSKNFEKMSKANLELTMKKVLDEETNKMELKFDDLDQKNFKIQYVADQIHLKIVRGEIGEGKS